MLLLGLSVEQRWQAERGPHDRVTWRVEGLSRKGLEGDTQLLMGKGRGRGDLEQCTSGLGSRSCPATLGLTSWDWAPSGQG